MINHDPLTQWIREATRSLRVAFWAFTFMLVHALMAPHVFALAQSQNDTAPSYALQGTPEEKMNQALQHIRSLSAEKQTAIVERIQGSGTFGAVLEFFGFAGAQLEDVDQLAELAAELQEQNAIALERFAEAEARLRAKNLPPEILQRHQQMVDNYTSNYQAMMTHLQALITAETLEEQKAAADALNQLMKDQKLERSHQYTDPNNLPWGTPDADKTREPATSKQELEQHTGVSPIPQGTLLASNVITPDMLGQPGGPVAEDLAETPDVKLTDAIKAKAEELEHDPVKIYNWVRNNIEFIPSYGSIQGADYTLQTGKGNAFDTASLLIALYRAANIPARYAYGTIQVPADQVMNWVGGVDVPAAAQQLLGQGGIPNTGLVSGGQVSHIRLEHVWVEAWVDYFPSRAAKHTVGDSWIPLDASFKQYEFTEGEDIASAVPFDAEGLVEQLENSATVNEAEGWVEGVNPAEVEAAISDYQQQIEDYINNQNPEATVGDVLGTQKVIIQERLQLAAGLPYQVIARTHNTSRLPDSLRHKFRYTLGTSYYGMENGRLITLEKSLPELAGKKLAVSFKPASQADEDLINSYLPEPDPETGEIDPGQMPDSLPGYLIHLTAELTQDSSVIDSGAAGTMGSELYETLALWSPSQGWQSATNHPIAGEYRAIGLSLQGASSQQAQQLQAEVEATKVALESADETQLSALTKHEVVGDLLYATIFSYLALNSVQDQMQSKAAGVVTYRLPSYGIFSTSLQTSYWFGMPRNVSFSGLAMDVDHLASQVTAKNNDKDARVSFVKATGARSSAMEHLVPEQMFSTEQAPAQGISAVKALALASAEGQRIWTIDQGNVEAALSAINLGSEIEAEIRNAVRAKKVATVHERPLAFMSGTSVGYLLIDPETGGGAYKISDGTNGGLLKGLEVVIASLGLLFGVLNAIAAYLGPAVPFLNKVSQYLTIAGFVAKLLRSGLDCPNGLSAVLFFITLTTVITLLIAQLALALANPIASFAVSTGLDLGFAALVAASQNCS